MLNKFGLLLLLPATKVTTNSRKNSCEYELTGPANSTNYITQIGFSTSSPGNKTVRIGNSYFSPHTPGLEWDKYTLCIKEPDYVGGVPGLKIIGGKPPYNTSPPTSLSYSINTNYWDSDRVARSRVELSS